MPGSIIQVNYDELQRISKDLLNESEAILYLHAATRHKVEALHGSGWTGEAANAFFREQEDYLLPAVLRVARALNEADYTLVQIMHTIHEADRETAEYFSNLGSDWESGKPSVIVSSDLLSALQNLFSGRNFMNNLGAFWGDFLNTINRLGLFNVSDILKFGKDSLSLVDGILDQAKWLDKFPIVGNLFKIADVTLGTLRGVVEGKDWLQALKVNTVDMLLQAGIGETGVGGVVLLANSAIQVGGAVDNFADKIFYNIIGDDVTRPLLLEQANLKAEALEKIDLGNITESISAIIVDMHTFSSNPSLDKLDMIGSDVFKTIKSTVNVLDGVGDMAILSIANPNPIGGAYSFNHLISVSDRAIQYLPLSNEIKRASSNAVHQALQTQTNVARFLVNLFDWR